MRSVRLLLTVVLLVYLPTEAASVKGRVLNSRNSAPIEGVVVSLEGSTDTDTSGADGSFGFENLATRAYTLNAALIGYTRKQVKFLIDSSNQVLELTVFLNIEGMGLVPGCSSDFIGYRSDLLTFLQQSPLALAIQIQDFQVHDSTDPTIVVRMINDTPFDVYLMKDFGYGLQTYVQKLRNASGGSINIRPVTSYDRPIEGTYHELKDVIRVARHQTRDIDTVQLWQYDFAHLSPGEYEVQLVYVFPQSQMRSEDRPSQLASPLPNEKAVGELYCMTLQGRFESNWLRIQVK